MIADAVRDLTAGLKSPVNIVRAGWWSSTAQHQRLRGSWLWMPAQNFIFIVVLSWVRSGIGGVSFFESFPIVATGFLVYAAFSGVLTGSARLFTTDKESNNIRPRPVSLALYEVMADKFIPVAVTALCLMPLLIVSIREATLAAVCVLLSGLVSLVVGSLGAAMVCAGVAARHHEAVPLVDQVARLLLFISPVFWTVDSATGWQGIVAAANPLAWQIEAFRYPLVGGAPVELIMGNTLSGTALILVGLAMYIRSFRFWPAWGAS